MSSGIAQVTKIRAQRSSSPNFWLDGSPTPPVSLLTAAPEMRVSANPPGIRLHATEEGPSDVTTVKWLARAIAFGGLESLIAHRRTGVPGPLSVANVWRLWNVQPTVTGFG